MLILKQNAANSVPTPPAGKGTIFLDDSDVLSVKTSDGNVENFPTVGASNAQVVFMNGTSLSGEAAFTYDFNNNVLTVSGNVAATRVLTDNLLYANGTAWDLQQPGGSNTQVQFNDADSFGGSANYTFNKTTNNLTVTGNIIDSGGAFYGSGAGLTSIPGANVSGAVPTATAATTAGTVTTAAQPNITSVGTLTGLTVSSTITGSVSGSAGTAGTVTTAAQPNITSVGTLTSLSVTGNANVGNIGATQGVFTNVSGNGSSLSSLTGANVTGAVAFATTANAVAGANVSGEVGFAAVANSVAGANVSGQVGNALIAGTVYTAAQPNITSVGTLTSLAVTGNASAGNVNAGNLLTANFVSGTLTTAAQPNVTSVGTLSSLSVTGNVAAGNLTTTGVLSVTGTGVSSIAGNLDMTSNTIINLATPTNASDAATKQYVDDVAQGLNVHDAAAAATTGTLATATGGTITYNNGTSGVGATLTTTGTYTTIDGVNIATVGTRVLVKNEANAAHNGIYTYTSSTVLTRATDYDSVPEVEAGDFIFVTGGTVYDNTGWVQTSTVATIGTDAIDFTQFSGAGTYNAGTGLTLTGTTFSVNASQTQVTALGTVTSGTWNSLVGSSATFAAGLSGANLASITGANVTGTVSAATVAGTVTTAAQPNITSVGTLTSLSVTGNISAGNVSATTFSGAHSGNGAALTDLNASNISSGTLAQARLANSSLTVNGTAISLGGSATITANTTQTLTFGSYLTGTSFNGGTANTIAVDATSANTASKVVARDASGNFSAGTITATLSGAATTAGTVTTAAQPNITSLGTLTGLGVNGTITAVNITANTGVFTGNANGISSVQAANIVGTTLSSTVVTSSLTTVGTITGGVWNNNIGSSATFAAGLSGANLASLNASNLSSGTVPSARLSGAYSISVDSATTAGTVTTAAQPNITSVGTLTSATVSGNITAQNSINITNYLVQSVATGISAAGSTQGTATALAKDINVVSTVSAGQGVVLPTAVAGMRISVFNTSATALSVYPATGGAINSLAANAAFSHAAGARLDFVATSTTQWYTLNATYA
jgi:hypothetical protein